MGKRRALSDPADAGFFFFRPGRNTPGRGLPDARASPMLPRNSAFPPESSLCGPADTVSALPTPFPVLTFFPFQRRFSSPAIVFPLPAPFPPLRRPRAPHLPPFPARPAAGAFRLLSRPCLSGLRHPAHSAPEQRFSPRKQPERTCRRRFSSCRRRFSSCRRRFCLPDAVSAFPRPFPPFQRRFSSPATVFPLPAPFPPLRRPPVSGQTMLPCRARNPVRTM